MRPSKNILLLHCNLFSCKGAKLNRFGHHRTVTNSELGAIYCPSRNQAGIIATGEIRQNIKFAGLGVVFLKKIKVDPES